MLRRSMGTASEGLRSEVLTAAFDEALKGRPDRLYVQLGIQSGLPGTRMNTILAQGFASECAARGKVADKLILAMSQLPENAPGQSEREFLVACGVLAIGARATSEPKDLAMRKKAIGILHDASEDVRFRVREVVPLALGKLGAVMGDVLVHELAPWMDGFFQASAALLGMAQPNFLPKIDDVDALLTRLDEAYGLAKNAARSTARYPGRKALIDALSSAPGAFAARFGVPVFDHMVTWSNTEDPELRGAIEASIKSDKLASRYMPEIKRVRAALAAALPPPRDPTMAVQGMRGRGKKRGRRS
ncbi:MAG: hypothetical protein QOI41_5988 [Myxococcales bacterium]|nr:hypothetical protein [Myxococcales bacterium]